MFDIVTVIITSMETMFQLSCFAFWRHSRKRTSRQATKRSNRLVQHLVQKPYPFYTYRIWTTYTYISASAGAGLRLHKLRQKIVYSQLWFFLWSTANSHHTCLHYYTYTCEATVHLATSAIYPFGKHTGVTTVRLAALFLCLFAIIAIILAAAVCFFSKMRSLCHYCVRNFETE